MSKQNTSRNQHIVQLRDKNPEKYSFRELGRIFRLRESTVHEIYQRDKEKYAKKSRT